MKRLLLVVVLLLFAQSAFASGYTVISWYQRPDLDNPVGQQVIPDECGTASSWGTTTDKKIIRVYNCEGVLVDETCWQYIFGQWWQQYC